MDKDSVAYIPEFQGKSGHKKQNDNISNTCFGLSQSTWKEKQNSYIILGKRKGKQKQSIDSHDFQRW